jgi:hypothetical protein
MTLPLAPPLGGEGNRDVYKIVSICNGRLTFGVNCQQLFRFNVTTRLRRKEEYEVSGRVWKMSDPGFDNFDHVPG